MKHIEKSCEFLQNSNKYPHILEFGVFSGSTISLIRDRVKGLGYEIYGFDSFEGLPEDWVNETTLETALPKGFFSTNGNIPYVEGVTFLKGWFENTIPYFINKAKDIALLHVDCDLYSSTKTVLYSLNDFIKEGTIIVFDEWVYCHRQDYNDHEQKCFYEWVKDFGREYELIDYNYTTCEQQIVRILK
jgi:hypothetical protein